MPSRVVAYANRLPVTGRRGALRPAGGGLVTALRPALERRRGGWVGWDGGDRGPAAPCRGPRRRSACRCRCRGAKSRTTTTASPTGRCGPCSTAGSSCPSSTVPGGAPTARSMRASPPRKRRAARSTGSTTTTSCCSRPAPRGAIAERADRLLPPHAIPAVGALARLPWRAQLHRGAARRRRGRLPHEASTATTSSARAGGARRRRRGGDDGRRARRPHRPRRGAPDLDRRRRLRGADVGRAASSAYCARCARSSRDDGCCSASTASTTRRGSSSGSRRSSSCWSSARTSTARSLRSDRRAEPGRGAGVRVAAAPGRGGRRPHQRALQRAGPRCPRPLPLPRRPARPLLAYYRLADVCLVTPLRDGMNLVAKEYVTVQGQPGAPGRSSCPSSRVRPRS